MWKIKKANIVAIIVIVIILVNVWLYMLHHNKDGAIVPKAPEEVLVNKEDGDSVLKILEKEVNEVCPHQVNDSLTLVHFKIDDDYGVYQYEMTNINTLDSNIMKADLLNSENFAGGQEILFFKLMVENNLGVCYEYKDAANKETRVVFTKNELNEIIKRSK